MPVVADVHAHASVLGFKHRISEIAGSEIKLLPESGMAVRDVMLAIFAKIAAVGVDDSGGVEIHSRHLFFVNRNHNHHAVFGRDLLHETYRGTIRYPFGEFVPARILLRTKIGPIEKFLQAKDLRFLARGLLD